MLKLTKLSNPMKTTVHVEFRLDQVFFLSLDFFTAPNHRILQALPESVKVLNQHVVVASRSTVEFINAVKVASLENDKAKTCVLLGLTCQANVSLSAKLTEKYLIEVYMKK